MHTKFRKGVIWGSQGSLEVNINSTIRGEIKSSVIVICHCFAPFLRYNEIKNFYYWPRIVDFNLPHMYLVAQLGDDPLEFLRDLWH